MSLFSKREFLVFLKENFDARHVRVRSVRETGDIYRFRYGPMEFEVETELVMNPFTFEPQIKLFTVHERVVNESKNLGQGEFLFRVFTMLPTALKQCTSDQQVLQEMAIALIDHTLT